MPSAISRYMTIFPHTIEATRTVGDARAMMLQAGVRHLPVVDRGAVVGVVSERDVACAERAGAGARLIGDVLPPDATYAVDGSTPLAEVARVMAERRLGSAVVMEAGELAGIFTAVDACRVLARLATAKGTRGDEPGVG